MTMAAAGVNFRSGQPLSLVVASGGTDSDWLVLDYRSSTPVDLSIQCPATLTGAGKIQTSYDASTWADLQSGGSNIVTGAGKTIALVQVSAPYLRILQGGAEGAARTFKVTGHRVR